MTTTGANQPSGVAERFGESRPETRRKSRPSPARVWVLAAGLVAISLASRLPQLRSPNLLLDGDEAYAGLMAKHLAEGREFPVFFYGQHYGFAPVETVPSAVAYRLFGASAVALKMAMLALWTAGVVSLFLALLRFVGAGRSFWITTLLLLNPAWAAASMKAWSGYVTAFTATAVLLWILAKDREGETLKRWLAAGALTALIYLAQPLWLAGVAPIVVVVLGSRRRWPWAAAYVALAATLVLLIKLAPATRPDPWPGPPFGNTDLLGSLPDVGRQIYINLTGSYGQWWPIDPPGPATSLLALFWCGALAAALSLQAYRLVTKRYCLASHLLFLAVSSTLAGEWILLRARDGRYLLPLSALLVLLAGVDVADLVDRRLLPKRAVALLTAALIAVGCVSMREFADFNFLWTNPAQHLTEGQRLRRVIDYLRSRGVNNIFSMNGMLDPQLVYYSNELVMADGRIRWVDTLRTPWPSTGLSPTDNESPSWDTRMTAGPQAAGTCRSVLAGSRRSWRTRKPFSPSTASTSSTSVPIENCLNASGSTSRTEPGACSQNPGAF
jgi:hypothetical protein